MNRMTRYALVTASRLISAAIDSLKAARHLIQAALDHKPRARPVVLATLRIRGGQAAGDDMTIIKETDTGISYKVTLSSAKGSPIGPDGVDTFAWGLSNPSVGLLTNAWSCGTTGGW